MELIFTPLFGLSLTRIKATPIVAPKYSTPILKDARVSINWFPIISGSIASFTPPAPLVKGGE